ncbi:MAG: cobalamin biosynthesis protein, partial [Candidatus Thermoplasmatota archaeon]
NVTDSIVSPIFYFAFFNVAGAMAFRVVNTLDAMIGYKTERYKNFGCFSARLDDVLNFLPARIAGLLICLSTNKSSRALSTLKAYRKVKLNSGWTLSAMSGALGVRLEKKGEYIIGAEYEKADEKHITKAIKIMRRCSWLFILISVFLITGLYFGGWQWFG